VIKKPRKRGGHSPRWAAKPEKIKSNKQAVLISMCRLYKDNNSCAIADVLLFLLQPLLDFRDLSFVGENDKWVY
jgi:hypothetical protein